MRVVVQRVTRASVTVAGKVVSEIGPGLLLLVGIGVGDGLEQAQRMARKLALLRIFDDEQGRLNLDVRRGDGQILAVSQFTLYGDTDQGNRPGFTDAARPQDAGPLFDQFCEMLAQAAGRPVQMGVFGAHMEVALVNDGPVTLILEG